MARQATVHRNTKPVSIHKDDPFRFACEMLGYYSGQELKQLAKRAEIHVDTMYRWYRGEVKSPQLRTIKGVIEAMGYRLVVK